MIHIPFEKLDLVGNQHNSLSGLGSVPIYVSGTDSAYYKI